MALYTTAELAEICGVTKQAVSKYIREHGLQGERQKKGNRFLISETAKQKLETHFTGSVSPETETKKSAETKTKKTETKNGNSETTEKEFLKDMIKHQQEQIERLQKSNEDLTSALKSTADSLQAAQALHAFDKSGEIRALTAPTEDLSEDEELVPFVFGLYRKKKKE